MDFSLPTYGLSFVAGMATLLSPCVLPILPLLLASALSRHRWGAAALALGLSLSFALAGTVLASLGASLGIDANVVRRAGAVLMMVFGLIMLLPVWQGAFARVGASWSQAGQTLLSKVRGEGAVSQLFIGLLLGVVWSPCVGPTLGAATTLAAQGRDLSRIALVMAMFGLGAGLPLLVLSGLSSATLARLRGSLLRTGQGAKVVLGLCFVLIGVLVLTGFDHTIEAFVLSHSPDWLVRLSTSL